MCKYPDLERLDNYQLGKVNIICLFALAVIIGISDVALLCLFVPVAVAFWFVPVVV